MVRHQALNPDRRRVARDKGKGPAIDGVKTEFSASGRTVRFEPGQLPPTGIPPSCGSRLTGNQPLTFRVEGSNWQTVRLAGPNVE
jgi:hypothetical protein